jgi:hypothetical protein
VLNIAIMIGYLAWSSKRVSHLISTHPSIINQIQASIIGEAIDRLDRYDEMQQNSQRVQDIVYTRQNTSSPSNQAIGMANTKIPPQRSKTSCIKGFGESVSQLPLCINVFHHYVFNMVSQEVVSYFYVFCSPIENWVLA